MSTFVGVAFGPIGANFLNPEAWAGYDEEAYIRLTLEISRIVIGFQVLITGINLPPRYIRKEWLSMVILLLPMMTASWLVTGLFVWWLIPGLSYLETLVVAACVVPTDPVMANSICRGECGWHLSV
jgi:NhaP-type Na+/H+ or K+/H+ antiporter